MANRRTDDQHPAGDHWRRAHQGALFQWLPESVVESDRSLNYVLLHGEDAGMSGWTPAWLAPRDAKTFLLFLDENLGRHAGYHIFGELERRLAAEKSPPTAREPAMLTAPSITWGFVATGKVEGDWITILVPELPGLPVQFCRIAVRLETAVHDIVIHGQEPSLMEEPRRSIVTNAFRTSFPDATIALTVSDSTGYTRLLAPSSVPPVAIAAAAAIAKAVGSWDESDPIVTWVNNDLFHAHPEHNDQGWHARVADAG